MKLQRLFEGDALVLTGYGERFLNDVKGRFEEYSEVNPIYDPQGPAPYVELPYTFVGSYTTFASDPSQDILDWVFVDKRGARFFWHPDSDRAGMPVDGSIRVQPTSSTRTLLLQEFPFLYIKTDLDKKHFRFVRKLKRDSVSHSVAITNDLRGFVGQDAFPGRYAFLPESLGVVLSGGPYDGSGVIFRETTPYPRVEDGRVMLPYHALYAEDPNAPEDKALLIQLVEMHGSSDPLGYFVSEVIGPLIEAWVGLVAGRGILPELHGQNALAEIDQNLHLRRVVHRDFQSIYSDADIRQNRKLPQFSKHISGEERGTTIQSQYSLVFDSLIGRYLLSRLIRRFVAHFTPTYGEVASRIRSYHHSIAGWESANFPATTYRFGSSASEQTGNDVLLVDTGQFPDFR